MHKILDSIEPVINDPGFVLLNTKAISVFCEQHNPQNSIHWLDPSPVTLRNMPFDDQLKFVLVLNSLSFCFWQLPKWQISFRKRMFDGSWGMVAALSKAYEMQIPILDFTYLRDMQIHQFNAIFEDRTSKMVLKEERIHIIKDVAARMIDIFKEDVGNLLKEGHHDAVALQDLIISEFPSFADTSSYKESAVFFNKRVQLLIADLNHILESNGQRSLCNIDRITACADYKIPFMLRSAGILRYSPGLSNKVDNRIPLEKGSREEVEIRSFAIWAVELIRRQYQRLSRHLYASRINDFLWLSSQVRQVHDKPYHLTLTTSY